MSTPAGTVRGFTLVEFIIVLAIVGILVGLGLPSLSDMIVGARVKSAASDIHSALVYARSEAIKRNANITVSPIGANWTTGWEVKTTGGEVLRSADATSNLTLECPSGTNCAQTVTWRGNGRLNAAAAEFVVDIVSPPTKRRIPQRCVSVGLTGQINILADNNLDGDCNNG